MASPSPEKKYRTDRCVNPFGLPGHVGKNLRKIPKKIKEDYPDLHNASVICESCRRDYNEAQNNGNAISPNNSTNADLESFDSDLPPVSNDETDLQTDTQTDLNEILNGLKNKFNSLPTNDPLRVSILTIAPEYWSIRKLADEFGTSYRMARKAKNLRKMNGVLALPVASAGKTLPETTVLKVKEFYEDDLNSRIMPNKKDTVSVVIDGEKQKKQKRFLMNDIKDLHIQFKKQYPEHPIGLTKFAELRPKWCILAGAPGTHSVCVCTIHQNFKAMIDSINLGNISNNTLNDYKDCINFVLCKNPKPDCYLNECKKCPDIQKFSDYVENLLNEHNIQQVIFSTWQSTDRCTLKKECLSSEDYVEVLCSKLTALIPHHFISKMQSTFISEKKNNLSAKEVLVQLDFAENYAYVAQNAAQAFHYRNDQSTIFPAVIYYKSDDKIRHFSIVLMSECTTHDATAVYIMQQKIVPKIRDSFPKVKKIIYASDGAKQHFKNRYQMSNLKQHKEDFGIDAEWHFFATAHGKGSCDGVGAIVKREAARASLQASDNEAILDVQTLFSWAEKRFDIKFFLYTTNDHEKTRKYLSKRFANCPRVERIQSGHAFIPNSDKTLVNLQYSTAQKPLAIVTYDNGTHASSPITGPLTRSST